VQTLEAKQRLNDLDKDLLQHRVISMFAHWESGNIERMLDFATDDIVCYPAGTWRHANYPRRIVGKDAVREALHQREINYSRMTSTVHRIIDCVNFLRFRDGLVAELQEFPDGSAYEAVINFPH